MPNPVKKLDLEVQEIERQTKPGCGSSTTSPRCTCPIFLTDTCVYRSAQ